jgi:hypothetical protein
MDFAEERTPSGFTLKVLFKTWKFLVFNSKGDSIPADKEGRSLLHKIPMIMFMGNIFNIERDFDREYTLLKIQNKNLIVPYRNIIEKKRKYHFIPLETDIDQIPVIIQHQRSYSSMLKDVQANLGIDYLIIDSSISETELSVVISKYKPEKVIAVHQQKSESFDSADSESDMSYININTLSENPVFLCRMHLRKMALSNLKQLLLDFDISPLDTQYILFFINELLEADPAPPEIAKNRSTLLDIRNSFEFYLALIQKDEENIKRILLILGDPKKISPYRTLVSKVRSMHPGSEDQLLYTEFENMVIDREEELAASAGT